ncbi:MAG: 16S rRNA (cytosine(1402)-N(4))-methyltransferase RsmH [Bacteroidetes bacterium]|nr:16S rRNA (cytosine(1402)-N(4))-methyltransferase RsmH [Bacteroidota bacterium]MDA0859964.1 16S rRNA (cytosine(1402)-N(4))-methyltransferase RsmH [Bacteroidota bacterium]MDA1319150.1 16S rRNA (cytosine(1402)-N(4))-methyltransferase RsmH [Bacteroidota bacterium]
MEYHNPVLLDKSVGGLAIKKNGVYVDVTFGGGGHSRKILQHLGPEGKLFAFDKDKDALSNSVDDQRFTLINENFMFMKRFLRFHGITEVDGVLADFGVSSYQFDAPNRGFSIRFDAPLDMRMNQDDKVSAKTIINFYPEEELRRLFWEYGELRIAPALARTIVEERTERAIETTFELKNLLNKYLPKGKQNKILAQIYQAIRIEVNNELEVLRTFLMDTKEVLKQGGRLSVISYHSLEDRLVKRFIRNGMFEGEPERDMFGNFSVPFKKVGKLIVPTAKEIKDNNRARSAKLRIAQKL